jgi:hypothetical protein
MTQVPENQIEKASEKKQLPVINELGFTVGQVATILTDSGFFGKALTPNQAITKIMIGQELGMNTMQSIMNLDCFDGNISIRANWRATAIKKSKLYDYRVVEHTPQKCVIKFYENGDEIGESSYTIEEAQKAGLTGKINWRNSPKNMLFARAISNGQRFYCPDVIGDGITAYDPDEIEEIKRQNRASASGFAEKLKESAMGQQSVPQQITTDPATGEVFDGEYSIEPEQINPEPEFRPDMEDNIQPVATKPVATAPATPVVADVPESAPEPTVEPVVKSKAVKAPKAPVTAPAPPQAPARNTVTDSDMSSQDELMKQVTALARFLFTGPVELDASCQERFGMPYEKAVSIYKYPAIRQYFLELKTEREQIANAPELPTDVDDPFQEEE